MQQCLRACSVRRQNARESRRLDSITSHDPPEPEKGLVSTKGEGRFSSIATPTNEQEIESVKNYKMLKDNILKAEVGFTFTPLLPKRK